MTLTDLLSNEEALAVLRPAAHLMEGVFTDILLAEIASGTPQDALQVLQRLILQMRDLKQRQPMRPAADPLPPLPSQRAAIMARAGQAPPSKPLILS